MRNKNTPRSLRDRARWLTAKADELERVIIAEAFFKNYPNARPAYCLLSLGNVEKSEEKSLRALQDWLDERWEEHKKDFMDFLEGRKRELED